jgi:hypothetical protein
VPLYLRSITGLKISGNMIWGRSDSHRQMIEVGTSITDFEITNNLVFCGKHASLATYAINFPFTSACGVNGVIRNNQFIGLVSGINQIISQFHPTGFTNVRVGQNSSVNFTAPYVLNSTNETEQNGVRAFSITANLTLDANSAEHQVVLADATSGPITVTLYDPASNVGRRVTVIKTDASSNPVTITGFTWGGGTTTYLSDRYDARTAISDHFKWQEIARRTTPFYSSVKDFGARGDGVTDDTTAINAAFSAANTAGGGTVFFPFGTYLVGRLVIWANTTALGVGKGSVLKLKDATNNPLLQINSTSAYFDDISVQNLHFDGNKANNATGSGIVLVGRRDSVTGCSFKDFGLAAIGTGGIVSGTTNIPDAGRFRITHNTITNCGTGIAISHTVGVHIADNFIHADDGGMQYGIQFGANTGCSMDNVVVRDNTILGGGAGIIFDVHLLSAGNNLSFTGNHIDCRAYTGTIADDVVPLYLRTIADLHVSGNTLIGHSDGWHGGIYLDTVSNFHITGNTIFASAHSSGSSYAIRFRDLASVATDGVVANNDIHGLETMTVGISSPNTTGLTRVQFYGNRFQNCTTDHNIATSGIAVGPSQVFTQVRSWDPPTSPMARWPPPR